jgi:hexosaminidase
MADKQWGGELLESEYDSVAERLIKATPGQNLDRQVTSKTNLILSYQFSDKGRRARKVTDLSGNKYHAVSHGCRFHDGTLYLSGDCYLETPLASKGRNYALSFSVNPTSTTSGTLFSGPDSAMLTGTGRDTNITLVSGGITSALNYSLPVNVWTHVTLSGVGESTYLSYKETNGRNGETEFLAKFEPNGVPGSNGVMAVWGTLAIEAPLARIGEGFTGMMRNITLRALN